MNTLSLKTRTALASIALASGLGMGMSSAQAEGNYVGLSVGRSDAKVDCGNALFDCDTRDTATKLTLGTEFLPFLGGELQVYDGGKVGRGDGKTSIRSADLFVVGKLPVGPLAAFGKLGGSYARTDTSASVLSGIDEGKASGWGPSYGVGVSYDLTTQATVVAEWEQRRIEFVGEGRQNVDTASVGVRYNF